jgi:hypothetical protein
MGAAADGALAEGGRVEGVILTKFWPLRHRGVKPMRPYPTFDRRKAELIRGAHAAAVFPGGYGTLDELGDLLVLKQTGFIRIPIVVVNVEGYFDLLLGWERLAARRGFLYGKRPFDVCWTAPAAARLIAFRLPRKP